MFNFYCGILIKLERFTRKKHFVILVVLIFDMPAAFAQTPDISYPGPENYTVNTAITPIAPTNSDRILATFGFGQVTTLRVAVLPFQTGLLLWNLISMSSGSSG